MFSSDVSLIGFTLDVKSSIITPPDSPPPSTSAFGFSAFSHFFRFHSLIKHAKSRCNTLPYSPNLTICSMFLTESICSGVKRSTTLYDVNAALFKSRGYDPSAFAGFVRAV